MPTGMKDFWSGSQVDIVAQALYAIQNRPTYGGAQSANGNWSAQTNELKTLVSVTGTGMLYGGYIEANASSGVQNNRVYLNIDGQVLISHLISTLNTYNINDYPRYSMYLIEGGGTDAHWVVSLTPGFTFDSSMKVEIRGNATALSSGEYSVLYATI